MHIICLGVNHTTAPLQLRERLAFDEQAARGALGRLNDDPGLASNAEMVILSTCNRIELYALSSRPDCTELENWLSADRALELAEIAPHLYRLQGEAALAHLLRVAAGLDSLVLGEPQILGQVTRAMELARRTGACGPVLSRLFQDAIHAGKRARAETAISRNPASVSSLAASLAECRVHHLAAAQIVVIGAGEMAELAVEALRKRGATQITVLNRAIERAQALAERWQAHAASIEYLDAWLLRADIVISSTSAPHVILSAAQMADIMTQRPHHPLMLIDIAVPRDIDPQAGQIAGITLVDIDQLGRQVQNVLAGRAGEVPLVEAILAEVGAEFLAFFRTLDMLPLIGKIRRQAEEIRRRELGKTLRKLPNLTDAERERIDFLTRTIIKKLLDLPIQRLKTEAGCPHAQEYATVVSTLFNLTDEPILCAFSGELCSSVPNACRPSCPQEQ